MPNVKVEVQDLSVKKNESVVVRIPGKNKVVEVFGNGQMTVWTESGKTFDRELSL